MKTSKFFLSTLVAAAAMTATAYADTTVGSGDSAVTYAGNIYTFGGWNATDFHNGGWIRNTVDENGNIVNSEFGGTGNWQTLTSETFPAISSMFANADHPGTLRFVQAGDVTIGDATQTVTARAVSVSFNSLSLGGLIVEEGATGNSVVGNNDSRKFYLGTGTETPFVGTINEDFEIKAVTGLYFQGVQNWTVGSGKTLTLTSNRVDFSETQSLTVNGGTIAVDSFAVVFNGLDLASTTFAAETAGLQEGVQETYTLYSGTGTISGLTATNVTVNGGAVTSVTGNTAVRELSIYNILAGSEANYTDEGVSTADRINVLGTLDCGVITGATGGNIVGTGTVKMESQLGGHGASLAFSNDFTGTVEFTGKLNTGSTSLSKDATLKLYNYSTTTSSLWGGGTLACDVLFQTNYQIGDSTGTTIVFSGDVTGATGTTVTITGNAVANFNGTSTFDTLNASGTIGLSGATSVTTMNIATGTTLNLNGVHNLTAESVVLNEGATLTLGNLSNDQNVNLSGLTGNGTISVSKTSGNHDQIVNLGANFAGTVVLNGYFNPSNLTLGNSEGTVKLNGVWFWGAAATFDKTVEFTSTADVGSTMNICESGGMTFNKGATLKEGAKFKISGETVNWGTLTLEANAQLTVTGNLKAAAWGPSNGGSKTLTVGENASLSVSGQLSNDSGLSLTNNGTITAETLYLGSGNSDTIGGSGTINATGLVVDNKGVYNVTVKRLNIGASGITSGNNVWNYQLVLGDTTIGASADWAAASASGLNGHVYLGSTENGGAKFDTNGHNVSIGTTLGNQSESSVGALTKLGSGVLTLSGANTYSGGTTISAGTLVAANGSALGSGNVTVEQDGDLRIANGTNLSVNNLSGNGDIMLESTADANTSATLTVNSQADSEFGGMISATYGGVQGQYATLNLVKTGTGTLTLSGGNGIVGSTVTVQEGRLSAGMASLAGANVVVGSGASLGVSGADGVYAGTVTFNETATLVVDLANVTASGDSITLDIISASAIAFGDTVLGGESAAAYSLRSAETGVVLPEGYITFENDALSAYVDRTWSYENGTLSLTLAIPEPSAFGLLAGLGALALVGTRRRRSKKA